MTDILLAGGDYTYSAANPFTVTFADATDLRFPFAGTLVVPRLRDAQYDVEMEESQVAALNDHDWLFYSYLHPRRPTDGSAKFCFPTLRTPENKPFVLDGNVLIWIAQDYSPLDDWHATRLFSSPSDVHDARYPENITVCCKPRYIVMKLLNLSGSPLGTPPPFNANAGYTLRDADPFGTGIFPAQINGEIYAFDLAGNQIEGYSALVAMGVDKPIAGAPAAEDFLIQFVDLHGSPLAKDALPVKSLTVNTPTVGGTVGNPDHHLYTLTFPTGSDDRTLSLSQTAAPGDATDYRYKGTHVTYWPGSGFVLNEVTAFEPYQLDLKKDFSGDTLPRFLRLCVFHPGDEFQHEVGGALNKEGIFAENKFNLYTKQNEVEIYNTGDLFFADLHRELTELEPGETIKEIYLANWRSRAHLFMLGNFPAYGLTATDADAGQIDADLGLILGDHVTLPFDTYDETIDAAKPSDKHFLLLAGNVGGGNATTQSFQVQINAVTNTVPIVEPKETHKGFVRAGSLVAWPIWGETGTPFAEHHITASWKTSIGDVPTTAATLDTTATPLPLTFVLPTDLVELAIDDNDLPNATLIRTTSYDDLLAAVNAQLTPDLPVDAQLGLLFLQLTSGRHIIIPLNPDDSGRADTAFLLHTFDSDADRIFATEPMAIALVDQDALAAGAPLADALLSRASEITYRVSAFQAGALPLSEHEWGGLLRQQIANGVKVKALYWDHIQANLAPGVALNRGLSNSAALTAVLNRVTNNKRGHAIRDAATRSLGAFHQKATVIVKELSGPPWKRNRLVAYVGGMDIDRGRWDREDHHHLDPERQSGSGWHDVQIKIDGDGAVDVLRNFKQRWEALEHFLGVDGCEPINSGDVIIGDEIKIPSELELPMKPGPFVQLTRTIPPRSCYTNPNVPTPKRFVKVEGELGSLRTYLDMIKKARKYIVINDQYLFSPEINRALHEALSKEDGPEFLVILLPKNIAESPIVDPLFFKWRRRAFHALFYGADLNAALPEATLPLTDPRTYSVHEPGPSSIRDKVALLTPVNDHGDEIYVHSKQIIVDDVVMSIGSANFTLRGSTYEMELNASLAGHKLAKGGTDLVREQRIEVCRRMLGLPKAYATLLQDWYASGKFFKALETQTANDNPPQLNLHPTKPGSKQLDPNFAPQIGGPYGNYNDGVSFALNMDDESPGFLWIARKVMDVDGRAAGDEDVYVRAANYVTTSWALGEFPRNPPYAYGRITLDLNSCTGFLRPLLDNGDELWLNMEVQTFDDNGDPTTVAPLRVANYQIEFNAGQNKLLLKKLPNNEAMLPLLLDNRVSVRAIVQDGNGDLPINGQGEAITCEDLYLFDPLATGSTYLPGSFHAVIMDLDASSAPPV